MSTLNRRASLERTQLIELARIIRGATGRPYPLTHDLLAQEALLAAQRCPGE